MPAYRHRQFPPLQTLLLFMGQALSADRSCQKAVNELARIVRGQEFLGVRVIDFDRWGQSIARHHRGRTWWAPWRL